MHASFDVETEQRDLNSFLNKFRAVYLPKAKLIITKEDFVKIKYLYYTFPAEVFAAVNQVNDSRFTLLIASVVYHFSYGTLQLEFELSGWIYDRAKKVPRINYIFYLLDELVTKFFKRTYPSHMEEEKTLWELNKKVCGQILLALHRTSHGKELELYRNMDLKGKLTPWNYVKMVQFAIENFEIENLQTGIETDLYKLERISEQHKTGIPFGWIERERIINHLYLFHCYRRYFRSNGHRSIKLNSIGVKPLSHLVENAINASSSNGKTWEAMFSSFSNNPVSLASAYLLETFVVSLEGENRF